MTKYFQVYLFTVHSDTFRFTNTPKHRVSFKKNKHNGKQISYLMQKKINQFTGRVVVKFIIQSSAVAMMRTTNFTIKTVATHNI